VINISKEILRAIFNFVVLFQDFKVLVARFTPGYISVFGDIDQFQLDFDAVFTENSFEGKASISGHPNLTMEIRGNKKQDL